MTTMRAELHRYFQENGFGQDGGYAAAWVDFKLGPVPFPFPNTDARRKAVRFHDLNHVLTGYQTDLEGEFEISAWEVGAGCRSFMAAWVINLSGLVAGALVCPKRTWSAFVAGRRSGAASYALGYEQALAGEIEAIKKQLDVRTSGQATGSDVALFAAAGLGGVITSSLMLVVLLSPITLLLWWRGRRLKAATALSR